MHDGMADSDATVLLLASLRGDSTAAQALFPVVYGELHALAERLMHDQRADHTLQPTVLVHEAWLRLIEPSARGDIESRQHFMRVAVAAMRSILVDHARRRGAQRRGGDRARVAFDAEPEAGSADDAEVLAVDEALSRLAQEDAELAQLVELRFFGGFSIEETAQILDVSVPTLVRRWRVARTWLARELA